jgi:16S rRNA G1207 methylase RsmC
VDAKSKKDHEVTILADFIQNEILLKETHSHIVDVGCGKGYLSIEIAERIKDNLSITMIDGAESNVEACKIQSEKKDLSKVIT